MTFTFLILLAVLMILIVLPQVIKRIVYKKLTHYLAQGDYEAFEKLLDGFLCTFSYKPYNREYMRLTSYFMRRDAKQIQKQLDDMFQRLKMSDIQKVTLAKCGFYFALEEKDNVQAEKLLQLCQQKEQTPEVHSMEMMYNILVKRTSDYIPELQERVDAMKLEDDTHQAQRVRIGIFEYLLGMQYMYQKNTVMSRQYLRDAYERCQNTPYESTIKQLLKQIDGDET